MTTRLLKQLIKQDYLYIMRTGDIEFGATKSALPTSADADYDMYECSKNETVKDLDKGVIYSLEELASLKEAIDNMNK